METKSPVTSVMTPYRLLFFFSQMLYQSIEYYRSTDDTNTNYSLRELVDVFPDSLIIIFNMLMLLCLCYGWAVFFLRRRVTVIMDILEYIGLPLAYMFLPALHANLDMSIVLTHIFPLIILTISTCAKLYFTVLLHHSPCLNEFVKADIYYPLFSLFRLCCLTVAKNFISPSVLIYLIVVLQLMSTLYKYFHIQYYNPETQWCSMVTEIWGWFSVMQWALLISGMRFSILNLAILPICFMVFFPSTRILVILERKVKQVLQRAERQRSKEQYIYLLTYYLNLSMRGHRKYLTSKWSGSFKLMINTKISEKNYRLNQYLCRMRETNHLNKESRLKQSHHPSQFENSLHVKSRVAMETQSFMEHEHEEIDIQFIKSTTKEKIIPLGKFEVNYFILYLLIDSELLDPVFLYQIYYQILELAKTKKQEIQTIEMEGIFTILRDRVSALPFLGNIIQQILQYDQLHYCLSNYVKNEKKFYALLNEIEFDLVGYRAYLDHKIEAKKKITRCMKVLEFMYPCHESLVMKNYIVERHVNNNQILSEERLMINISRLNAHKTRMVNFASSHGAIEDYVFVCTFLQNRGQILHRNKKFDAIMETSNSNRLKFKDILPTFWRDDHDMKVHQLSNLEELYHHNADQPYYLQSISNHRYFEAKQVIVMPYFELQGEMLLLVRLRIDEVKEVHIKEVEYSKVGKRPVHTHKTINLKSRSSISNMVDVDETEKKSRRNLKFKEEQIRMYDIEQKTVNIFNKQYRIESKTSYLQINTRNMIQTKLDDNINEDIEAVIKVAAKLNDTKMQLIEKNKSINILKTITVPFALLVTVFSLLFATGATSIRTSSVSYNILISQSANMKLEYYAVSMCIASFYQIFKTFNCQINLTYDLASIPEYQQKYQQILRIIPEDTSKFGSIYDRHQEFTKKLSKYDELVVPVFSQYYGRDMQEYKQTKNIMDHLYMMNIMLDSAGILIKGGQCSHWIVKNFYDVINWQGDLLFDQSFLEYVVTVETQKLLTNKIHESEVVFWLVEFFNVLSPIFVYIIFWKSKCKIENILTKPLYMNQSQKSQFRVNFKSIQSYLTKQQTNKTDKFETVPNVPTSSTTLAQKSFYKQTQSNIIDEKQEQKHKDTRGSFFNLIFVLILLMGFHLLTVMVCSKKLFVAKSQFISTLEGKLSKFQEFASFNSDLFMMFNGFLQLIAHPEQFTPEKKEIRLKQIRKMKAKLNEMEINDLVTSMLIDPNQAKQILFGNPCSYVDLCLTLNRSMSAYPTELSLFFTTFYKLQNLYLDPAADKLKLSVLIYQAYASSRSIAEIIFHINSINFDRVNSIISQNDVWIALSYIGYGCFLLIMFVALAAIIIPGTKYGCQILSVLPSRVLCRSKMLEYEVNCISYGTNFAQNRNVL